MPPSTHAVVKTLAASAKTPRTMLVILGTCLQEGLANSPQTVYKYCVCVCVCVSTELVYQSIDHVQRLLLTNLMVIVLKIPHPSMTILMKSKRAQRYSRY